jgi:hypothetical protein
MSQSDLRTDVDYERDLMAEVDRACQVGYQPPRHAGEGRPLHEPVADLPALKRRPSRGLAVMGPNRTGGATDANFVAEALADVPRMAPRAWRRPSADDIVNAGSIGVLTEQVCGSAPGDPVLSSRAE